MTRRKKVRDRLGGGITVACVCRKRLAVLNVVGEGRFQTFDGVEYVAFRPKNREFVGDISDEDWLQVTCTKCRRDQRWRVGEIVGLLRSGEARNATSVTLDDQNKPNAPADFPKVYWRG